MRATHHIHHALTALAAVSFAACADGGTPTAPVGDPAADVSVQAKPAGGTPTITSVLLSSAQLVIGGSPVAYTVTIDNPGKAIPKGAALAARLGQGGADRDAGSGALVCDGFAEGVLPTGTCVAHLQALADNAADGSGTLAPGAATLDLTLLQLNGKKEKVLDGRQEAVTLGLPAPYLQDLLLSTTELVLEGFTDYSVTLVNPTGQSQSGIVVQSDIVQGTTIHAAGGFTPFCSPGPIGTLPAGSCPGAGVAWPTNSNGSGTLVPGPADFVLKLTQNNVVVDADTVHVTLVAAAPSITGLTLDTNVFVIDGPAVGYSITLANGGADVSTVGIQAYVEQGASSTPAGGVLVCAAADGVLPSGGCTFRWSANASTGFDPLVPGPASLRIVLFKSPFDVLDTRTVPIDLVAS